MSERSRGSSQRGGFEGKSEYRIARHCEPPTATRSLHIDTWSWSLAPHRDRHGASLDWHRDCSDADAAPGKDGTRGIHGARH